MVKQALSKVKALEKMELIADPKLEFTDPDSIRMQFPVPRK